MEAKVLSVQKLHDETRCFLLLVNLTAEGGAVFMGAWRAWTGCCSHMEKARPNLLFYREICDVQSCTTGSNVTTSCQRGVCVMEMLPWCEGSKSNNQIVSIQVTAIHSATITMIFPPRNLSWCHRDDQPSRPHHESFMYVQNHQGKRIMHNEENYVLLRNSPGLCKDHPPLTLF
ncbi:hypothetical protein ILYODFUR_022429 [Ilyodon furcidens]|uniref:Uncharacterized protein n=1 Tax=Ilyodon furcidens TaxID=33524 RepID=A0ABV0UY47_9TELE